MKKLIEIESLLSELRSAALPLPETLVSRFEAAAPGHLALLARVVRMAGEAECDRCDGSGWQFEGEAGVSGLQSEPIECDGVVCRVRREMAGDA